MHLKITLLTLESMLEAKQQQIKDEPSCNLWLDEEKQLMRAIELVEMESENYNTLTEE